MNVKYNRRVRIDYQKFNDTFQRANDYPSKKTEDDFVQELYFLVERFVDSYKHSKLTDFSREDMKQFLVMSCWQTFKRASFKDNSTTPYWYYFGIVKNSSRFFMEKEPDHQYLVDFSPGENDGVLNDIEQDFSIGQSEFIDLYMKYTESEEIYVPEFVARKESILKSCFKELSKQIRFNGDRKEFIKYAIWFYFIDRKPTSKYLKRKARQLKIEKDDEKFLIQYCKILYKKFLLDLRLDVDLRRKVLNEV